MDDFIESVEVEGYLKLLQSGNSELEGLLKIFLRFIQLSSFRFKMAFLDSLFLENVLQFTLNHTHSTI